MQNITEIAAWIIPENYDYRKSSESNYCCHDAPFVGKYSSIRSQLDYSYHKHYSVERQLLHDKLIDRFLKTKVHDPVTNIDCEVPLENWIVFTAGPMGAGKGHTMQWLNQQGLFPFDAFVNVDPDALRQLLPETQHYNRIDNNSTGYLTQKEVNYISEVLSYHSLLRGKNVLVDGSLRNAHWYLEYFRNLREKFPKIKIAILHVTARPETVLLRARNRALVTGRHVPEETILESMRTIPDSLAVLGPHAEFVATFLNEDNEPEPHLRCCCMQDRICELDNMLLSPSRESATDAQLSQLSVPITTEEYAAGGCRHEAKMVQLWSLRRREKGAPNYSANVDGSHSSENSACPAGDSIGNGGVCAHTPHCESKVSRATQPPSDQQLGEGGRKRPAGMALDSAECLRDWALAATSPRDNTRSNDSAAEVEYVLEDAQGEVVVDSWKGLFSAIWEMKCALPEGPADASRSPRGPAAAGVGTEQTMVGECEWVR